MKKHKFRRNHVKPRLRAKLTFDQGFAENPVYSIKGFTNEKEKGIGMIKLIKNNFSINGQDIDESTNREVEEWNKEALKSKLGEKNKEWGEKPSIKWTRDEKGNIKSPFATKKEETSDIN